VILDHHRDNRRTSCSVVSVRYVDDEMDTCVDDRCHRFGGPLLDAVDRLSRWEVYGGAVSRRGISVSDVNYIDSSGTCKVENGIFVDDVGPPSDNDRGCGKS
jgi:hypothetical protein